jgi:S-DNA-T family DNA segregation ATPase FtsK/SpoIIIE
MLDEQKFYVQALGGMMDYLKQELNLDPRPPYQNYKFQQTINGRRYFTLRLRVNPTPARKIMSMSESLSMAAGLDKDVSLRVVRGRQGTLLIEVPKPKALWRPLLVTEFPPWYHRGVFAPLGADSENRACGVDFKRHDTPHILIAGATGSGKSNAARLVIYDLALQNKPEAVKLILVDAKKLGAAFGDFRNLPHLLHPLIVREEQALQALAWGVAEMDRRAQQGRRTPRIFYVIDEAQELLPRPEYSALLADLTAVGREWGLHVGLVVQNPTADNIGDMNIKRNVQARLVGSVDSAEAARAATGQAGTGAEKTLTSTGDMLLVQPGEVRRLITALLSSQDLERLPLHSGAADSHLPLADYEDPDHVRQVAEKTTGAGRTPDPLEPEHVFAALVEPEISQNELYRRFKIGRAKQRAIKQFATELLRLMQADGYFLGRDGGTEQKEIPLLARNGL